MKLYRYRGASAHTFAELAEETAWYSRYDELNDPFEGTYINRTIHKTFDELLDKLRVCCFSRNLESLLLWTHYADNHRGLCLEYEIADDVFRTTFFAVEYRVQQPVIDEVRIRADGPDAGTLILHQDREGLIYRTKSQEWSYEDEFRTLRFATQPKSKGEKHAVPGTLTGVYFGLRAGNSVIRVVEKILQSQTEVRLWQASLVPNEFRLQFAEILPLPASAVSNVPNA